MSLSLSLTRTLLALALVAFLATQIVHHDKHDTLRALTHRLVLKNTSPSHQAVSHCQPSLKRGQPLGAHAAGVCLRNSAFVGLPLPLMQLLASCAPLLTYALSVAVGMNALSLPNTACMAACIAGVTIAVGDRNVAYSGAAMARHAAGIGSDVAKGVVLQMLIRRFTADGPPPSVKKDGDAAAEDPPPPKPSLLFEPSFNEKAGLPNAFLPSKEACRSPAPLSTVLLAMYSPLCAAMLAVPAVWFELGHVLQDTMSRPPWFWLALAGNIAIALGLNLVAVACLQHVGVVALSLTAFAKNWGLVVLSTLAFGREVTPRFIAGMLVTTAAVAGYANLRPKK